MSTTPPSTHPPPGEGYLPAPPVQNPSGTTAWTSTSLTDPAWDAFLESTHLGQFPQCSGWAQYKHSEGWNVSRLLLTQNQQPCAGFQILWKQSRLGKIGYASKAPVLLPSHQHLAPLLIQYLKQETSRLHLQALITQTPDEDTTLSEICLQTGFLASNPLNVIEANCVLNLSGPNPTQIVENSMDRNRRRSVRKALRAGLLLREGVVEDISTFFDLMQQTCSRQHTQPNPGSAMTTLAMWHAMSARNNIRLTFADYQGSPIAGLLSIHFGSRYSLFKTGWNGHHPTTHPNEFLYHESLLWAANQSLSLADWVGISRHLALGAQSPTPNPANQNISTRDAFILRFGGTPVLLPPALLYIPNPVLQLAYKIASPLLRRTRISKASRTS